jgi:hypothetical protein
LFLNDSFLKRAQNYFKKGHHATLWGDLLGFGGRLALEAHGCVVCANMLKIQKDLVV